MQDYQRYAIYWAPPAGPLADFGAAWLGWDPACGEEPAHPEIPGLPLPVRELTYTPRKYGLHATMKPPFRLVAGTTRAGLAAALEHLASTLEPVVLAGLAPERLGNFLALVPQGDTTALARLAARFVRELDPFRAPLTPEDLIRRQASRLSGPQQALLDRWGYPFVMEEFRFHVTLTGKLGEEAAAVEAALAPVLAPLLPRPFVIGDICLFGEAPDGRFHLLHRYPLSGSAETA